MSRFSLDVIGAAIRDYCRRASLGELLAWCLPALIFGAIARALLMVHFPYGYIHPDSPDFLVTSERFLFHHRFVLHGKKSFLSPILFLLPMLVRIPCVLFVPWAQHLSGLVYTVMVGALVRCWTERWKWWIVPATLLATLNPALLYYEHAIIAESQYLWCVTALVLAGSAYALDRTPGRYLLLLLTLFLTAGSRPEGKLYVLFCLLLIPLLHWGRLRALAVMGCITLAFSLLTWSSTRNTQAGVLLYSTLLPLAPETPKSAPDFGPIIDPMRKERVAMGPLFIPNLVPTEKAISPLVDAYLKSKGRAAKDVSGDFCQKLAVEAALQRPLLLPVIALVKFLMATVTYSNDGFGTRWLQTVQIVSCTYKPWMLTMMPRLTGLPIHTMNDVVSYIHAEFTPVRPDWFNVLQRGWYCATTKVRAPWPGEPAQTPGIPLFYLLGVAGLGVGMIRPGPMRSVHIAWGVTLAFTALVVMLTGVVNPRYRFVFEPFVLLYLFVLADWVAALGFRRARQMNPAAKP